MWDHPGVWHNVFISCGDNPAKHESIFNLAAFFDLSSVSAVAAPVAAIILRFGLYTKGSGNSLCNLLASTSLISHRSE